MTMLRTLFISALVVSLAACSATNVAERDQDETGQYQTVIQSNNALLKGRVNVVDMKERQVGDLLQVQSTLENQWKFQLDFQYKFKWFDASGFEIAPESQSWRQLILPGRGQANVQGVAPNPSVTKYEIWVQE
ncbi:MAG: YcfL family protein [Alcanivoracaceae bacterium]|nr:YcfL family protein [Alcanivoracaceae bacterium]